MTEKQRREWVNQYLQSDKSKRFVENWAQQLSDEVDADVAKNAKSNSKKKS